MKEYIKNNNPRQLIAKLRNGAYAHPGEEEAIDIMLEALAPLIEHTENLKVLDVGCGLGGTANYIKQTKKFNLTGIDIDKNAIDYAKQHYPDIHFIHDDITKNTQDEKFDIVYLFNVLYQFEEKEKAISTLANLTKTNGLLVISDYTTTTTHDLTDLAGKPMHPINAEEILPILTKNNFNLIKTINLDSKYSEWYEHTLKKLKESRNTLLTEFTEQTYTTVEKVFEEILSVIKTKQLGGEIIYAIKAARLFPNTKRRKDAAEEVVGGKGAGDFA